MYIGLDRIGRCKDMYQISNEKFGKYLSAIRKEKNLTQKQLAEKLFVSDKTVSKWERGASMPNIVLLIPIADVFGVTVTELLKGESIDLKEGHNNNETESMAVGSVDLSIRETIRKHHKKWTLAYLLCLFLTISEIFLLKKAGLSLAQMKDNVLLVCALMLIFSGWFCFFAKKLLPVYYDENKVNYYSQGIFRVHMPGVSFNNGNWAYICTGCKAGMMSISVLYPLICYGIIIFGGTVLLDETKNMILLIMAVLLVIAIYVVGKKYE